MPKYEVKGVVTIPILVEVESPHMEAALEEASRKLNTMSEEVQNTVLGNPTSFSATVPKYEPEYEVYSIIKD